MTRMDTKGRAGLDAETLRLMYRHMLRSRLLDERLWVLNRHGRAPFWISAEGHEAAQVAFGMNLRPTYDWVAPYYRDLALTLVLGMTPLDHVLSVLQRAADPNSGGRQKAPPYGWRGPDPHTTRPAGGAPPVSTRVASRSRLVCVAKML